MISPKGYDDVYQVLKNSSISHLDIVQLSEEEFEVLKDTSFLLSFDIIFLNCHRFFHRDIDKIKSIAISLKEFLSHGGTLYASDWASSVIYEISLGKVQFEKGLNFTGLMDVKVSDPLLVKEIGRNIRVFFDMGEWEKIIKMPAFSEIYMRNNSNEVIAASFLFGKGKIIFTSFHHHGEEEAIKDKRHDYDESKFLEWLITLSTQHLEIRDINQLMLSFGPTSNATTMVGNLGREKQKIQAKYEPRPGIGCYFLNWKQNREIGLNVKYLKNGEKVLFEKKSFEPPVKIVINNPQKNDIIEIKQEKNLEQVEKGEEMQLPFAVGYTFRRDIFFESDWLVLSLIRNIYKRLDDKTNLAYAKEIISFSFLRNTLENLLNANGFIVKKMESLQEKYRYQAYLCFSSYGGISYPSFSFSLFFSRIPEDNSDETNLDILKKCIFETERENFEQNEMEKVAMIAGFSRVEKKDQYYELEFEEEKFHKKENFFKRISSEVLNLSFDENLVSEEEYSMRDVIKLDFYKY